MSSLSGDVGEPDARRGGGGGVPGAQGDGTVRVTAAARPHSWVADGRNQLGPDRTAPVIAKRLLNFLGEATAPPAASGESYLAKCGSDFRKAPQLVAGIEHVLGVVTASPSRRPDLARSAEVDRITAGAGKLVHREPVRADVAELDAAQRPPVLVRRDLPEAR